MIKDIYDLIITETKLPSIFNIYTEEKIGLGLMIFILDENMTMFKEYLEGSSKYSIEDIVDLRDFMSIEIYYNDKKNKYIMEIYKYKDIFINSPKENLIYTIDNKDELLKELNKIFMDTLI